MTLTVAPPPERTVKRLLSTLAIPLVSAEGSRNVVVIRGEADLSTRPVLAWTLSRVIALREGAVVIDLEQAAFVDTATVRVLAMAQRLLVDHGRSLTFRSSSRLAARMLDLFGLAELIEARDGAWS